MGQNELLQVCVIEKLSNSILTTWRLPTCEKGFKETQWDLALLRDSVEPFDNEVESVSVVLVPISSILP